jgi:hypothetical protein
MMDPARGSSTGSRQTAATENPEQLLDVFKAAALSVTKLYKTSAAAESKARSEGYQECLEDLLFFLDKENIGLCDGEGWQIRRWATERLDGRDNALQSTESEDEVEKTERTASPEITRTASESQATNTSQQRAEPCAASSTTRAEDAPHFVVPTQDNFTFQSSHPYPNIGTLDLSDSRPHENQFSSRAAKARLNNSSSRVRGSGHLGRGAGTKRRINFDDFFGGCFGGKDPFNQNSKRGRHM